MSEMRILKVGSMVLWGTQMGGILDASMRESSGDRTDSTFVRVTVYQCKLNAIMRESEKRRSLTLRRAMLEDRYSETMSMKEVESKGNVYRV